MEARAGDPGFRVPSGLRRVRLTLFLLTGLTVPFYAFPVLRFAGKLVDLATLLACAFVAASLPAVLRGRRPLREWIFLAAAISVPLLALIRPRIAQFDSRQFAVSYVHWLIVISFFFASLGIATTGADRKRFVVAHWCLATVMALFALYQAVGIPRHWPATGPILVPFQREPFRFTRIGGTYLGGGYTRPTSVFLEPAWVGGYLCWVLAIAIVLLLSRPARPGVRALKALALSVPLLAILATVSWGSYLDLVVVATGLVLTGVGGGRPLRAPAKLLGLSLVVAVAALFSPPGAAVREALQKRWQMLRSTSVSGKEVAIGQDSSRVRLENIQYAQRLIAQAPARGIGLGQFGRAAPQGSGAISPVSLDPWCGWLGIAAEAGLLGPAVLGGAILLAAYGWNRRPLATLAAAAPVLAALAAVQQLHTGSYIDLWWWYPLGLAAAFGQEP